MDKYGSTIDATFADEDLPYEEQSWKSPSFWERTLQREGRTPEYTFLLRSYPSFQREDVEAYVTGLEAENFRLQVDVAEDVDDDIVDFPIAITPETVEVSYDDTLIDDLATDAHRLGQDGFQVFYYAGGTHTADTVEDAIDGWELDAGMFVDHADMGGDDEPFHAQIKYRDPPEIRFYDGGIDITHLLSGEIDRDNTADVSSDTADVWDNRITSHLSYYLDGTTE